MRASRVSRRLGGSSPSVAAAASSSTKKALPPERAWIRSASSAGTGAPWIPASWAATSAGPNRASSSRSTRRPRSSSARNGRRGWRRCSSSLR